MLTAKLKLSIVICSTLSRDDVKKSTICFSVSNVQFSLLRSHCTPRQYGSLAKVRMTEAVLFFSGFPIHALYIHAYACALYVISKLCINTVYISRELYIFRECVQQTLNICYEKKRVVASCRCTRHITGRYTRTRGVCVNKMCVKKY